MKVSEVFREAAKILAEPGVWVSSWPTAGHHCINSACGHVAAGRFAGDILRRLAAECDGPSHTWNDMPERTLPEVLAVLESAAVKAELAGE